MQEFENHLNLYEKKLFDFYSGFPCNICNGNLKKNITI